MAEEYKVPSTDGGEFRGGKQSQHVKPVSQNQTGNSNNSNQSGSNKK